MNASGRNRWLGAALLVAIVYLVVGLATASLAGSAASIQMRTTWRMSAFLISAIVFGIHGGYEHMVTRGSPRATALHASLAVAAGAFALAAGAWLHNWRIGSGQQRLMTVALVAWPVLTGVPAFLVALVAAAGLARGRRGT